MSLKTAKDPVSIDRVDVDGDVYFKIENCSQLRPFFMSIVSDADHWMFISSNGGLSAGRRNANSALFPYYTDDKITQSAEFTGSKSIFRIERGGETVLWEPFSIRNARQYNVSSNLYKGQYGNTIIFEEINHDLGLTFRYQWSYSDRYGFVRQATLTNTGSTEVKVELLDGLQNIMPASVPSDLQNASSNLVDAYKRSELEAQSGVGIFALSAIIVDRAEPSEALKANVAWSYGLDEATYLLSSKQLDAFRAGEKVTQEEDIKGEQGAYFVRADITLEPAGSKQWTIIADVNKTHSDLATLIMECQDKTALKTQVETDIVKGTEHLIALNASADGIQCTADAFRDARHFANVLFNIMRGGVFDDNYHIVKEDFMAYLHTASRAVVADHQDFLSDLPAQFTVMELESLIESEQALDLKRLAKEYLPLMFSRRHGDPSRPWNKFSINIRDPKDGSKVLDYEGNWRDIFQNWEAMVHAYPRFIDGMILRFMNASTFDGYNPYRVTKDGFDWEIIEPDDPWSYIGYWGDHQIIYLLKFLEFIEDHYPHKLEQYFDADIFVYADVPYRIKPYEDIVSNPKDTIVFMEEEDRELRQRREELGVDGCLLRSKAGDIHRVNFIEKTLATLLAKLSNYIPDGGIWMNTQRPEWNDANNALVGNGVSMVTLYYIRRFLTFLDTTLQAADTEQVMISEELLDFYQAVATVFYGNKDLTQSHASAQQRQRMMEALGQAGAAYRNKIYDQPFTGQKNELKIEQLQDFIKTVLQHVDQTIESNKRPDDIYHAYNLVNLEEDGFTLSHLSEMLEGQVAILSAGYLDAKASLKVLDGLKASKLFRPDQYSYLLYPQKELKGFLSRNVIPEKAVEGSALLTKLLANENTTIVEQDAFGKYHFNGNFRNVQDLYAALNNLDTTVYGKLVAVETDQVAEVFEQVFNHKEFTGRSGTFYGYEGLGSIYWHMVSKLLLAVQECAVRAVKSGADDQTVGRLLEHFYEIYAGLGVHKSPSLYGAFPTDPYSHTPAYKGAQQPGMTGQVKEDILSRFGELGVFVEGGQLSFNPFLLRQSEFLTQEGSFKYVDLQGQPRERVLPSDSLAFTYCQVPIIYQIGQEDRIVISLESGDKKEVQGSKLSKELSHSIFDRSGQVETVFVTVNQEKLK